MSVPKLLYSAWEAIQSISHGQSASNAETYRREVINRHLTISPEERQCARFLERLGPEFSDLDPMNNDVRAACYQIFGEDKSVDPLAQAYVNDERINIPSCSDSSKSNVTKIKERIREAHPYPEATGELKTGWRGRAPNYSKLARA